MDDDHEGIDDDFEDLDDELLAAVEQAENQATKQQQQQPIVLDDDFDDLDSAGLILAAEAAEKQHCAVGRRSMQQSLTSFFSSSCQQQQHKGRPPSSPARAGGSGTAAAASGPGSSSTSISAGSILLGSNDFDVPPTPPAPPPADAPCAHAFDAEALPTWIYPINYPLRLYQFNIVKKALFHNTLVALPTGLGKTFIAAVVMYNYWRWFPQSKVIFMAPTKPLVAQQVEACFNVCGIPQSELIEITGETNRTKRKELWRSRRVFFITPQTLQKDLEARVCPAHQIACIVVDEAHKAVGNYAYCEVVRLISREHSEFRLLALTATPGTNLIKVQEVISQLRITNIQIRTEDSMDIQEYSFGKRIQNIIVRFDHLAAQGIVPQTLAKFRDKLFEPVLQRLSRFKAIYSTDVERNSPFGLLQAQRSFTSNARNFNGAVKGMVYTDFSIAQSLSRAYDYLSNHGIGPFLEALEDMLKDIQDVLNTGKHVAKEKERLVRNYDLRNMMDDLRRRQAAPGFLGHPKMERLVSIILQHFAESEDVHQDTRVIVFTSFRASVHDIIGVLSQHQPIVQCSPFIGQGSGKDGQKGLNQREQKEIVEKFKRGQINVLVATSIGEEGLDIGEVDLIVCYDSQSSPIRMLQRMGRTGRKRKGHCVMIMTEQEEAKFKKANAAYTQVQRAIARGGQFEYHKPNPSVLPEGYRPVWCQKEIAIGTFFKAATTSRRGKKTKVVDPDGTLTDNAEQEFVRSLGVNNVQEAFDTLWPRQGQTAMQKARRYMPHNTQLTSHGRVGHGRRTVQFVSLVKSMERRVLREITGAPNVSSQPWLGSQPQQSNQDELILPERPRPSDELILPERPRPSDELILPTPVRPRTAARAAPVDANQPTLSLFLERRSPTTPQQPLTATAQASDDWPDDSLLDTDLAILDQPVVDALQPPAKRRLVAPTESNRQKKPCVAAPSAPPHSPQQPLALESDVCFEIDLDFDSSPPRPATDRRLDIGGLQPSDKEPAVPRAAAAAAAAAADDTSEPVVEIDLDFSSQDDDPGQIANRSISYERILPPELSKSTPLMDDTDQSPLKSLSTTQSDAAAAPAPAPAPAPATNITPAMLKWLTTRPPAFSSTAKLLIRERMNVAKIKAWIGVDGVDEQQQQQPKPQPPEDARYLTPSFGDDDDFDIDIDVIEALENKIPIQHASFDTSFHQMLENKVGEDYDAPTPPLMSSATGSQRGSTRKQPPQPPSNVPTSTAFRAPRPPPQPPAPSLPPQPQPDAASPPPEEEHSSQVQDTTTTPLREDDDSSATTLSPSPPRQPVQILGGRRNDHKGARGGGGGGGGGGGATTAAASPSPLRRSLVATSPCLSQPRAPQAAAVSPAHRDPPSQTSASPSPLQFARRRRRPAVVVRSDDDDDERPAAAEAPTLPERVVISSDDDDDDGENRPTQRPPKPQPQPKRGKQRQRNPFLDLEAELGTSSSGSGSEGEQGKHRRRRRRKNKVMVSEDEHTTTDLSQMEASFIDDGSPSVSAAASAEDVHNMYRISLMSQQPTPQQQAHGFSARRRTWLDKFEADKWLNHDPGEDDDDIVNLSRLTEEAENEGLALLDDQENDDDDDDFM